MNQISQPLASDATLINNFSQPSTEPELDSIPTRYYNGQEVTIMSDEEALLYQTRFSYQLASFSELLEDVSSVEFKFCWFEVTETYFALSIKAAANVYTFWVLINPAFTSELKADYDGQYADHQEAIGILQRIIRNNFIDEYLPTLS